MNADLKKIKEVFSPKPQRFKLILIIILAALIRSIWITNSPPSLYVDETVIGYNAYSLAETGGDEYGMPWPVILRSYGAFSSALYTFLTVPVVKIFGLSVLTVRLVSILSGVGLVILIGWRWGLLASLVAALTPVFVFYSRGAFEANLALFLLTAGLFAGISFLKQTQNKWRLYLSAGLLALSTYAYLAEKFISPILFILIILFATGNFIKKKHSIAPIILSIVFFGIITLPLLRVSFTSGANQRMQSLLPNDESNNQIVDFASRYYAYFSPQNLFYRPDPDIQRSYPKLSVFYWWWILPFLYGLSTWLQKVKKWQEEDWLMLILLFISPLAGAVTKDYFSTLRVLPMYIPLVWLISRGINQMGRYKYPTTLRSGYLLRTVSPSASLLDSSSATLRSWFSHSCNKYLIMIVFALVGITSLYYNAVLLRYERNKEWSYPYRNLALEIAKLKDKPVVVDNSRLKPFYIYYAFVNKLEPKVIQDWHNLDLAGYYSAYDFSDNMDFQNMKIRPIDFKDVYDNYYLVADEISISPDQAAEHFLTKTAVVNNLDGNIAFNIYQTNPLEKCRLDLQKTKTKINPFCVKYLK